MAALSVLTSKLPAPTGHALPRHLRAVINASAR
jgi:hypothetical protein